MPDEEEEEEEVDDIQHPRKKSKGTKPMPPAAPERKWEKKDINAPPLPPFQHPTPDCIHLPFEYFQDMFTCSLLQEIVYQTNLYARQKDVNTSFHTDKHEVMMFLGIILYMGISHLPAIDDYWATETKVSQVADVMSSKRFCTLRSMLHFNNNEEARSSTDRFFKIRPIFCSITRQFLQVMATPTQSIDEVMVVYKGTTGDKWGYKLFCRVSIDGFIHDILMYQGDPTFTSHHTPLTQEESVLPVSSQTVVALAKTIKNPQNSSIYANNYFTSMNLMEYLKKDLGCRYVRIARVNRIGNAPLKPKKEMEKKTVLRGEYEYCSANNILALHWRDNDVVTVLSSDAGLEPVHTIKRYDRISKKKVVVNCPSVIKEYNKKMGGIDKSNRLTHFYKTPMHSTR